DNCLGQSCPDYSDCFVMHARRNALAADVVVINHHLFFADVVLRDEGIAELLPSCNTVVFDEAHQLAETARLFFGEHISSSQLVDLARLAGALERAARELRLSLGEPAARLSWTQAMRVAEFPDAVERVHAALGSLNTPLQEQAERSEGLGACARRSIEALGVLARLREGEGREDVRWVEVFGQAARLNITPLSSAELFARQMSDHPRAWIFTSATLAVGEDFGHFTRELGLQAEARR